MHECDCDMCYCRSCSPCMADIALELWNEGWRPPGWADNPVMELEWSRCQ